MRMLRLAFACAVCLVILGSRPARVAGTPTTLSPIDDSFVRDKDGFRDTNFDEHEDELLVTAQGFPEGSPVDIGYLRFDLTGVSGPVGGVRLRVYNQASPGPGVTVSVYSTNDDDWNGPASGIGDETTLTFNNAPQEASLLDSESGPAAPAWMEFSSSALTEYVNNQMNGDGVVTFKLKVTSTGIADINLFEDRENGGGTGNNPELIPGCILGDVNCDCTVDARDMADAAAVWRSRMGDATYDADRDINRDGIINVLDLMRIAAEQGNHC